MKNIPVNEPKLDGNEMRYLCECIETGWISSEGPNVRRFEEMMAARVGRKYGVAVCNGTAALDVSVAALGIGPGDEVILPSFTIISCAAAIVRAGATPIVVDSDPRTWNMDLEEVEKKITSRTKAVMAVHIYGLPVDMNSLLKITEKKKLMIIEDAAEMIGQRCSGRLCGSFGDVSTFSFYPNKHITTGEGGMVLTDDPELVEKSRGLRNLCLQSGVDRFIHQELGWNYRMTNMQAALGLAQLEQLDEHVEKKRFIGRLYNECLSDVDGLQLPSAETSYARNIYWVYGALLGENVPFDAKEMMRRLSEEGIGSRPFFWPMHEQPVFKRMGYFANEVLPTAERLARRGFYLPSGLSITEEQIRRVANSVKKILNA